MNGAADRRQDKTEREIGADNLRGSHFRIIQEQHGAQGSGACGGKSRFQADRKRQPRQPMRIFSGETGHLRAGNERNTGRKRQQDSDSDNDQRVAALLGDAPQSERPRAIAPAPRPRARGGSNANEPGAKPDKMARQSGATHRKTRRWFRLLPRRGVPTISSRAGTVKLPPPIPVSPTESAMTKPRRKCVIA